MLPKEFVGIMWVCFYPCGEIFDCYNIGVSGNDCVGKFLKIKPLVWSAFQHPVVQVESVYVEIYFHSDQINAKAGLPRPCAASAVPWRVDVSPLTGSVRIVPNSAAWRKEGARVCGCAGACNGRDARCPSRVDMNKRWGQIEAA